MQSYARVPQTDGLGLKLLTVAYPLLLRQDARDSVLARGYWRPARRSSSSAEIASQKAPLQHSSGQSGHVKNAPQFRR
jgi:hypothetical protein